MVHPRSNSRFRSTLVIGFFLLLAFADRLSAQSLPAPWTLSNVGSPTVAGSTTYNRGVFSLTAAGSDVGGVQDQFSLVQQRLTGDVTIVARVRAPQSGDPSAKAGVMIRESLDPASRNLFATITGSGNVSFQRRRVTGGDTIGTDSGAGTTVWLKIERRSSTFLASRSTDGATWTEIGTEIVAMPSTLYVGLALTSHNDLSATTVAFSSVSATASATLQSSASQPQGWSGADVGLPAQTGSETQTSGVFTITGGGSGLDGSVDQFHYMYKQVTGDVDIVARVKAVQYINASTIGGVMVRDSLSPNGAHGSVSVQSGGGVAFQSRNVPGGATQAVLNGAIGAPSWVMLQVRSGMVTGWSSPDGSNWTQVGTATPALPPTFYVGVAVASTSASTNASSIVDNLAVNVAPGQAATASAVATAPDNRTSSALTAEATPLVTAAAIVPNWTSADIGSPAAGSTQSSNGTYTIKGAGGMWHTDQFRYMYQAFTGDITITAHVLSQTNTNGWAKAGVSIREALTTSARHTSMVSTPANGTVFFHRDVTGQSPPEEPIMGGPTAPAWVRVTRQGSLVTAYYSSNGTNWTAVGTTSMGTASMYVGLLVSSEVSSQTSTAVFDNVTLDAPTGNQPPTVSLTAPADGATFTAPAAITLSASASDSDGTIAKVDFYANGVLLGSDSSAPYSYTWNNVAAGSYTLAAVASDNSNATTTSATRTVSVTAAANQAPTVSLTAPANGATYTAPATVTLTATASDTDGTVSSVSFYAGATLIGTDASSPYSVTWNSVPSGSYSLTAVAVDDDGATTTSAARSVTVNAPPNQAPAVSLTAPANGATFTEPATITVSATASDADGTVSSVSFYSGATLIAIDTTSPYSVTWNSVPSGTYSLTAVAQDNNGAQTTSAARSVTVTGSSPLPPPSNWTSVDIGSGAAGSTQSSNGTYTINGAGGMWHSDQFRYMYQAFSGDVTLTAHVVSQTNTNDWAKAGVSIREALTTTARHTSMISTPGHGTVFFHRDVTGQSPPEEPIMGGPTAPAWVRVERRGSVVTAYYSNNGTSWTAVGTTTMATANMYVGLMVSSEVSTQTSTAVFDNVTLSAPTGNQSPTVSLTAPANGATFTAPATVTLTASASDADGTVASVSFYAGTTLIGTDTTSPYSVTWNNAGAGSYTLTAVATDNAGATTTSPGRSISVSAPANQPPTVSLTAPANGATYTAPATVTITASPSDADGTIARVDFYAGSTLIGSATGSPYSFTWNSVSAGSYSLTAVARDNAGATTTSAARSITVSGTTGSSTHAVFTASADHNTLVTRYQLEIFTAGSNPNTATPVATKDLGKPAVVSGDCDVDITQTVNALAAGSYIATVSAVGSGGSNRSASVSFTK